MSEEEKEAKESIEYLKARLYGNKDCEYIDVAQEDLRIFTNLIDKQQKENEDLKNKNKTLEELLQGTLYEMYKYYRDLANSYQANCILKEKVKDKIIHYQELQDNYIKKYDEINEGLQAMINVLKELLVESEEN